MAKFVVAKFGFKRIASLDINLRKRNFFFNECILAFGDSNLF